jgi:hypothetical protein
MSRNVSKVEVIEDHTQTLDTEDEYIIITYKGEADDGSFDLSLEIKGFGDPAGYDRMKEIFGAIYRSL